VEKVGRHDNFFELGGHSLLAIQATARAGVQLRLELALSLLFRLGTIATLAAEIETLYPLARNPTFLGGPRWNDSSVLLIRPGHRERPIFLIHPMGGGLRAYGKLIQGIQEGPSVYGVHAYAPKLRGCRTITEISRQYAEEITAIADSALPILVGFSLGGIIASEVGNLLAPHCSPYLILLDPPLITEQPPNFNASTAFRLFGETISNGAISIEKGLPDLAEGLPFAELSDKLYAHNNENISADSLSQMFAVYTRHMHAIATYQIRTYNNIGRLYQATAEGGNAARDKSISALRWPHMQCTDVHCRHTDLVTDPHVAIVMAGINDACNNLSQANK
jgi:thioesterase domain-containing protein